MTRRQSDSPTAWAMLLAVTTAGVLAGLTAVADACRRVRSHRHARDGNRSWRWRLAGAVNHLPGSCWADLVSFALGHRWMPWQPITATCRRDAEQSGDGRCYCGKLTTAPEETADVH